MAGLLVLFPGLRRSTVSFRHEVADAECIDRIAVDLFQEDSLERAHRQSVDGEKVLHHEATLRNGEYLAVIRLECGDGPPLVDKRQPIIVDRDGVMNFKLDGHRCCVRKLQDAKTQVR